MKLPNQSAAPSLRPAGQSQGSNSLSAPNALVIGANRAFPAAVAMLDR
jgi:hypothetical protein